MDTQTTITISTKTRNLLMRMKYDLGKDTIEDVILSLLTITKKIEGTK